MARTEYRVGELARKAGVTVRTLHHWENVGLLEPSHRTRAGHRIYDGHGVARVQRIRSLKAMGMGLEEIRLVLSHGGPSLMEVLKAHRSHLRAQIRSLNALAGKLERVLEVLDGNGEAEEGDLLDLMEAMTVVERYFTHDQLHRLEDRGDALGPEAIREVQKEWPELIGRVREAMARGVPPSSSEVQALAHRWRQLVQAFSGGDPEIEKSLENMYRREPRLAARQGLSPEILQYLEEAMNQGVG